MRHTGRRHIGVKHTGRRHRGFTLVELLLALLIISVLAALLFPVFARARESARKAQCLSNVANLASALQMYAVDWGGALPPKDNDWAPIYVYAKNMDVLHCPMDPTPLKVTGDPNDPDSRVTIPYSSYIYRAGLSNDDRATEITTFDRRVWHLGGRNVAFLDGHGKWFAASAFWQIASPRILALDPAFQALNPEDRELAKQGRYRPETWP